MANPGLQKGNRFHSTIEAIIKGRQKVSLPELIEVIHRVNPTGRLLDDRETAERYRLKSMVQSFLIDRHRELVQITPMPGQEEHFVALSVVGDSRGACHARLEELAPEARSWVRLQLDIRDDGPRPAGFATGRRGKKNGREGSNPEDPLASARMALAEYDFPQARELAERAWRISPGVESGLFLLELLVDHLALFAEALDFGEQLPPPLRASAASRCLLARAATHNGEFSRAGAFLHKLSGPQAVESWLTLAHAALAGDDLTTAEVAWRELTRIDDTMPGLADLRQALLAAQTRARRPEIEALLQAWSASELGDEEAEAKARLFLTQGLLHPGLTALVKTTSGKKKSAALASALAQADKLFAREDYALAAQSYTAALELGGEEGLRARLTEAKNRAQAQKEETHLKELIAKLKLDSPREALAEYLELEPAQRMRVREESSHPELARVEELAESARGVPPREVVAAALALDQAGELHDQGEWRQMLALLEPHKAALKRSNRAKELEAAAGAGVEKENRILAREKLRQIQAALRQGQAAEAMALLSEIDPAALSPEEEDRRRSYQQQAGLKCERSRLERELLDHEEKAAWVQVRENLDALREQGRAEELLLRERRQEIEARINRQYGLRYIDLSGCQLEQIDVFLTGEHGQSPSWLSLDGQTLAVPASRGPWATIRLFDLAAAAWRGAIVFWVGEGWTIKDFMVREDGFWLAGGQGEVFSLTPDGSNLQAIYPPVQNLGEEVEIEKMFLAPPQHLWLQLQDPREKKQQAIALGLEKRNLRELGDTFMLGRLTGREPRQMWRSPWPGERVALHNGPGHRLAAEEIEDLAHVSDIVMASRGAGWAVVVSVESAKPDWEPHLVLSWVGEEGGKPRHSLTFPEAKSRLAFCLATSRREGCSFLHYRHTNDTRELVALVITGEGIEEKWRLTGLDDLCLLTDDRSERVVAFFPDDNNRLRPVELGNEPPLTVPRRKRKLFEYDFDLEIDSCSRPPQERRSLALAVQGKLLHNLPAVYEAWIARQIEQLQVDNLLAYHHAFKLINRYDLNAKVVAGLVAIAPDHPEVIVLRCHALIEEHNYAEVRPILEKVDWSADLGEQGEHLHHLWGLTHLQEGELAEAARIWKEGCACAGAGHCRLGQRSAIVEEAWRVSQGAERKEEELGDFAWLLQLLPQADQYLREGRGDKVFELLHNGRHWNTLTIHSLARLVQACLLQEPAGNGERLQWVIILNGFLHAWREREEMEARRPLPPAYRLQPALLEQLREEVQQWLDQSAWD